MVQLTRSLKNAHSIDLSWMISLSIYVRKASLANIYNQYQEDYCPKIDFRVTFKYLVKHVILLCHAVVPNVAIRALSNVILHIAIVADRRITMQM
jgi:hypothetical protein